MTHELTTLESHDLRIVSEHVKSFRSVALGIWIGVGSRDEPQAKAGISHFIEHLLFRGTSSYGARQIAEVFDTMGGELNAATSRETTVLYVRIPDDQLEKALDVMTDMVFRPLFADLETEREVVLEEIAMVDDNPQDHVHDLAAEAVFGTHPLGRPVIGRADVIESVGLRSLRGYHGRAYVPENIVVAAAGNVDHQTLVELLETRVGNAGTAEPQTRKAFALPRQPGLRFLEKDTEQYHVCVSGPGVARNDDRRYAASLLDTVVGGSASSRLFQEIREQRGLAYSVYTYASQYVDGGQIGIYLGTREENLRECFEIVQHELDAVVSGALRPGELERAKDNLRGRILLGLESTSARMTRLGKALVTDTEIVPVDETVARIDAVSSADIAELAAELLVPSCLSVAGIGPSEERFHDAVGGFNASLLSRAA